MGKRKIKKRRKTSFDCSICDWWTNYSKSLDRHYWIMHGIPSELFNKIWGCPYCDYFSPVKGNVADHESNVHRGKFYKEPAILKKYTKPLEVIPWQQRE